MIESSDDRNKAGQLYVEYAGMMQRKAYGILRNHSLSEDAVHQAFVKIIENLSKINEISCPQTASYCVTICERVAIDMLRREHRNKFVETYSDNSMDEVPSTTNIEDETIMKMDTELLTATIAKLPNDYREIVYLYYSNEFSLNEVAKTLHIPIETAKKRLQRARQKLEKCLGRRGLIMLRGRKGLDESREVFLKIQEAAREAQRREMISLREAAVLEPHVFSIEFNRKMDRLLRLSRKPYYRYVNTVGKRVAVFALALLTSLTIMTSSVQALREGFINFIISVGEVFTSILFRNDTENNDYPTEIEQIFLPLHLPVDYSLIGTEHYGTLAVSTFTNGTDELIFQQFTMNTHLQVSTEDEDIEQLFVGDIEVVFTSNRGANKIIWTDSLYGYVVYSILDKEELLNLLVISEID